MDKLKSIIVDDELMARENLKILLEDFCPEVQVVGLAENIKLAKELIFELQPDVVFLDIRMPSGAEGFELLESIENRSFQVVFVTAFKDYAIQALNVNAIHYILKPIDIEDLKNAVTKLISYEKVMKNDVQSISDYNESVDNLTQNILHNTAQKKITLFHAKGFKIIEIGSIVHLEAKNNYTIFYFDNGDEYMDSKTLKFYDDLLQDQSFLRVHKSHVINLNRLKEYKNQDGHIAFMDNGNEIPISRAKLSEFITAVKSL